MKKVKQGKKKPKLFYKEKIPTHKRYKKMLEEEFPEGEEGRDWWVYSYIKGNQIKVK